MVTVFAAQIASVGDVDINGSWRSHYLHGILFRQDVQDRQDVTLIERKGVKKSPLSPLCKRGGLLLPSLINGRTSNFFFNKGEHFYFPLSKRGIEGDFPDTSRTRLKKIM